MDTFEFCWFRHDACKASSWLQRSVVNLASPQECRGSSKALPHRGGNGKIPGGIPHLRHHRDDGLNTDRTGKPTKISESSIYLWNESQNEFGAKVTVTKFGNSQRSLLSPTKGVKSTSPTTENDYEKLCTYSMKNDKSTEDKHETNHINNKYNDMNMNTRKMHNTWAWTQARILSHFWCWVTCTSWLKCSWVSYHPHSHPCASLLEFTSLTLYFDLSFTILSLFFPLMHFEQHTELDNLIAMQNLRTSANKGSNDAYDVSVSLTLVRNVVTKWNEDLPNIDHPTHGNWVVYFKTWSRRSSFSGRARTCRDQSNVWDSQRLARHTKIREQNPSLGYICPGEPHQRSSNAPKFEDRSLEETEWQEQGAREAAWKLAKSVFKLKEQTRATFFSPSENRSLPASTLKPEEREFVVDSGASMHMISKKDLSDAEMDTLTDACSPTTVITANGEVQTHEEATVYVKELDVFLTMKVLDNTTAVLSFGKFCDENGYSYERINGQKPHLKTGFGYLATRKTLFLLWFQDCQVRPMDLHQLYGHLRDRRVIPHHPLQPRLLHVQ